MSLAAFACYMFFLTWQPEAFISGGPLHLFYKLTPAHTYLLRDGGLPFSK